MDSKWNSLYKMIRTFSKNKIPIKISIKEKLFLRFDKIKMELSGCGKCKSKYDSLYIEGTISNKMYNYILVKGEISKIYFHKCVDEDVLEFNPILRLWSYDCDFLLDVFMDVIK